MCNLKVNDIINVLIISFFKCHHATKPPECVWHTCMCVGVQEGSTVGLECTWSELPLCLLLLRINTATVPSVTGSRREEGKEHTEIFEKNHIHVYFIVVDC